MRRELTHVDVGDAKRTHRIVTVSPVYPPISAHMRYLRDWMRERILPDMGEELLRLAYRNRFPVVARVRRAHCLPISWVELSSASRNASCPLTARK